MSFENSSAENRNQLMTRYQLMTIPRTRKPPCCSFCRSPTHNISICTELLNFEATCASKVTRISDDEFKLWLRENYRFQFLKIFLIRRFPAERQDSHFDYEFCINKTTNYIYANYRNILLASFDRTIASISRRRENYIEEQHNRSFSQERERKFNITVRVETIEHKNEMCKCNICWEETNVTNFVKFGCEHEFCKDCVINSLKTEQNEYLRCALCRADVKTMKTMTSKVKTELSSLMV